jgi:hypothetical protein
MHLLGLNINIKPQVDDALCGFQDGLLLIDGDASYLQGVKYLLNKNIWCKQEPVI